MKDIITNSADPEEQKECERNDCIICHNNVEDVQRRGVGGEIPPTDSPAEDVKMLGGRQLIQERQKIIIKG